MLRFSMLAVMVCVVALTGCASSRLDYDGHTALVPYTPEELELHEASRDASYALRTGDTFGVVFKYEPDLTQRSVVVLPDGKITMPGIDPIRVAGLTVEELDRDLTAAFAREFEHPDLAIVVEELSTNKVYVLGEVRSPGLVKLPLQGGNILQAIAQAGGFSDDAASSETVVIRLTQDGYLYRRCDIDHLEKGGVTAMAIMDIQPFDVIYVPRSALGDLVNFNRTVLSSLLSVSQLYWEFYAIANLDKVDRILR